MLCDICNINTFKIILDNIVNETNVKSDNIFLLLVSIKTFQFVGVQFFIALMHYFVQFTKT